MSKVLITQTNGATAEEISDAIGEFLDSLNEKDEKSEEKKTD